MSTTGKQSPLGVNVNSSLLQNIGLHINAPNQGYIGISKSNANYTPGSLVNDTCLKLLTYAIYQAYNGNVAKTPTGTSTYDNLIAIGNNIIPSLGNSKSPGYTIDDPTGQWQGEATTGYSTAGDTGDGQNATWIPYNTTNNNKSVTQWGFLRLYALQAWNEFNWNGIAEGSGMPEYKDFVSSFLNAQNFIEYSNVTINAVQGSSKFLKGTYSNMNDLISADVTGVSLATQSFGQDCITAGKVIDLSKILKFGLPSVLLQTIKKYNTITQSLVLALLSAGLSSQDIDDISSGRILTPSKLQEQQIYGAFLIIIGQDLADILIPLNCKTEGLESLADLLNIKKLFPNSYQSLTVPIYNANPGPTNAKTYYPIFDNNAVSARIEAPAIVEQIGVIIPPSPPPIIEPPPPIIPEVAPTATPLERFVPESVPIADPNIVSTVVQTEVPIIAPTVAPPVLPTVEPTRYRGGGCPAPWINIMLADRTSIPAKDIKEGMLVYTQHETTKEWGNYPVIAVSFEDANRWEVAIDDIKLVGSPNHRMLTEEGWIEIERLMPGDIITAHNKLAVVKYVKPHSFGEVVKITVEDAHTYLTEGLVSHNIKKIYDDNVLLN